MRFIYNTIFFQPLYNGLAFLTDLMPGGDIGLAVILLTIVVRVILFPLQHRMSHTQRRLKELEPVLSEIKTKHADNRQKQAEEMMALYRAHGINPFSGFLLLLIQLPLLWALYRVFQGGFDFDSSLLYSAVSPPTVANHLFLNIIDLTKRSIWLAILAGVSQFWQLKVALPPPPPPTKTALPPSLSSDLAKNMQKQMRYTLPGLVFIFSLSLPSAIALYWVTSNLFGLVHELVVRRQIKRPQM